MTQELIVERGVDVSMRDGVKLRAVVYRPQAPGRYPVLLQRTPYGKDFSDVGFCVLAASRGYAVVVQDTRGRWESEGEHHPMSCEFDDGYDTVEWAAAQPWANGKVGMWGGSYVGWTQWSAAVTQPPSLVAICPNITFTDCNTELFRLGGTLALGVAVSWYLGSFVTNALMRLQAGAEEKARLMERLADALDGLANGSTFGILPLSKMPFMEEPEIGGVYQEMLDRLLADEPWADLDIRRRIDQIGVPALHLGGWYDIFSRATLTDFALMREHAANETARRAQKVTIGPWLHGPLSGVVGEFDFGVRASDAFVVYNEVMLRWFDHWLKGVENRITEEPPVRLFVMGRNEWRSEQEWPLARTVYTPCYLHSVGRANSLAGDGTLSWREPGAEPADTYTYDPRNPVPTRGGNLCCSQAALAGGPFDQRPVEGRQDVLVYTSEPLQKDLEVTGPVRVKLWAATDAVDTDWTAKLVDVYPCGRARNVVDGVIRARYRAGMGRAQLLRGGEVVEYSIDLGPTSNVFLSGHRLRLEVSSSNYPKYDRNPNLGRQAESAEEMRNARQTIYHDAERPSQIVLPVIPASGD